MAVELSNRRTSVRAFQNRMKHGSRRSFWSRLNSRFLATTGLLALAILPGFALAQSISISPTELTVTEGNSTTTTISVSSDPGEGTHWYINDYGVDTSIISIGSSADQITVRSNNWSSGFSVTVTGVEDNDSDSERDRFSFCLDIGNCVNVRVTVIDDDDSTGPGVASGSGYYDSDSANTALTGPIKGVDNIYTKVVFNDLITNTASDTDTARPEISYKIGTNSAVRYDIVAPTETLANGDCKPIDVSGDTEGAIPTTTYICMYTSSSSDSGDFGFEIGTATTDVAGNAASTYSHTAKIVLDNAAPTVSSVAYYSDASTSTSLTGPAKGGSDVYTKVTFNEKVKHTANDGTSARPEINYTVGNTSTQYDIVSNTATLASGDCKPTAAPLTTTYVCRYSVGGSDSGTLGFEVDTGTQDEAGNALASAYTPSTTITLEPAPIFNTTYTGSRWNKNYVVNQQLPAATGGDAGTTLTYTLSPTLPTGLTFNPHTRRITGIPTVDMSDTTYTYTVTETDGDSASLSLTFRVSTKHELIYPAELRVTEGSTATLTVKFSSQPPSDYKFQIVSTSVDSSLISGTEGQKDLVAANWNTGVSWTITAKEDDDSTVDIDNIRINYWPKGDLFNSDLFYLDIRIADNDDSTALTVNSGSSGFYADANGSTVLTGPVIPGIDIYSKVKFSKDVDHDTGTVRLTQPDIRNIYDRPEILYQLGTGSKMQYEVVSSTSTLSSGQCKPTSANPHDEYICRYTTNSYDSSPFKLLVGTNTEDLAGQQLASEYTHSSTIALDSTIPTFSSAAANGSSVVLTFSENLNTSKVPAANRFSVSTTPATSVSTVAISGKTVTLTVSPTIGANPAITVSYTQPSSNRLQDPAGNKVASFSDQAVKNDGDTTAPTATLTPASSQTAVRSKDVAMKVTFSEPVYSAYTNFNNKTAFTNSTAKGIITLKKTKSDGDDISFSAQVVTTGTDANKVFNLTLDDGDDDTVDKFETGNVYLAVSNAFYDTNGNQGSATNVTFAVDETAPALHTTTTPAVNAKTLTLTFDESLDTSKVPAATAFAISAPNTPTVSSLTIAGAVATLTLDKPVLASATNVTVAYTKPATGDVFQDALGNEVASFAATAVTVNTDSTVPTVTIAPANSSKTNASTIVLTFSEAVYSDSSNTAFTDTSAASAIDLKVSNNEGAAISFTAAVTTTGDNANKVITLTPSTWTDGKKYVEVKADSFYDVDGNVGAKTTATFDIDRTAPTVSSAKVAGTRMTVNMNEALVSSSLPAASRFVLSVSSGTAPTVSSYTLSSSGTRLDFILSAAITKSQTTVTLAYTAPTGDNAKPLKDAAENLVANISSQTVTNGTDNAPTITFSPANGTTIINNGSDVVITFSTTVYSDHLQTAFTDTTAAALVDLKQTNSSGNDITHTAKVTTSGGKTVITLSGANESNGKFADGVKYVEVDDDFYDSAGNQGSSANITFTVDTVKPTVDTTNSGFFSDSATNNALTTPVKIGDDIYLRVVFSEPMKHVAGSDGNQRPKMSYTYNFSETPVPSTAFEIVAATAQLGDEECQPMAATNDYALGRRYLCRYTVASGDTGQIGFSVSADSQDAPGNTMSSAHTSMKRATRDGVLPTVEHGKYYSEISLTNTLSGTVKGGTDIYTEVQFSETMEHVEAAGNIDLRDGTARPVIAYKNRQYYVPEAYAIVENTGTLESGECWRTASSPKSIYVCRYTTGGSESGDFRVVVGRPLGYAKVTKDEAGNAIAAQYRPASSTDLTREPAPVFSGTVANQSFNTNYSVDLQLPIATGGDSGTTLTYSLSPTLPAGLFFNATTRKIRGTPTTDATEAEYTYTVTETDGDTDTIKFKIKVSTLLEPVFSGLRIVEGSTASVTVKMSTQPSVDYKIEIVAGDVDSSLLTYNPSGGNQKTIAASAWNTGVAYSFTAKEDADATLDTDAIRFSWWASGNQIESAYKTATIKIVDNDAAALSVTAGSSGYFSNVAANTTLTGPVGVDDIYTKVKFNQNVQHVKHYNATARPVIFYKLGEAAEGRYEIVDSTKSTIEHGECRPTAATPTSEYVCRYTTTSSEDGNFDFRVGTNTEGLGGQQLASKYTHTTKLLINNNVPELSTASVNMDTLTATFSETLDSTEKPDKSDFTVTVGSDTRRIKSYTMSGAVLTFKLVTPVQSGETITLGYTQSTVANAKVLKDLADKKVLNFSGKSVTNANETTVPTLSMAVATRTKVTLTFSENMKESPRPSVNVFSLDVANTTDDPNIFDYTLKGNKAELLLSNPIKAGQSLTVTYTKPDKEPNKPPPTVLEDPAGNDLATITNRAVTNSTVDLLVVNKTSLTINEAGTGTFKVKLAQLPADDVVVAISGEPGMPGYADDNVLDFTTGNWNVEQTVTMTGRYDPDADEDTGTIEITASASGSAWGVVGILGEAEIELTVTDTASSNSALITPDSLTIAEGSSGKMSVKLAKEPAGDVRVRVSRNETHDGLSVSPAVLIFTKDNFATAQDFTFHAEQDQDTDSEVFGMNLILFGGGYDMRSHSLMVRTVDTGSGSMIVTNPPVLMTAPEGGSTQGTVKLSAAPTGNVTVNLAIGTSPSHRLTVSPSSLTFSNSNYGYAKTFTVSSASDANAIDERAVLTMSASGGGYNSKSMRLELVSADDELMEHEQMPTNNIIALKSDSTAVATPGKIPSDGKIKVAFNKDVGTCSLKSATVCEGRLTLEPWESADFTDAHIADIFELVRIGFLDDGETRKIPFTVSFTDHANGGMDVVLTPTGLAVSQFADETKRIALLVGDNFWSVDGGRQGSTNLGNFEVVTAASLGGNAPSNRTATDFLGKNLVISNETTKSKGCLNVEDGLAVDGQNVQTWDCDDSAAQQWRLERRTSGVHKNRYRLVSGVGDGDTYCLDNDGHFTDSSRMSIWKCVSDSHSNAVNQSVDITPYGTGWGITFVRNNDGAVLWAERQDNKPRGNVGQRRSGTGNPSIWHFTEAASLGPVNPDPSLTVSVADAQVVESDGAQLVFSVSLGRAVTAEDGTVSVDYATSDNTATAGSDYTAASGTLTFSTGEFFKNVNVAVLDDSHDEDSETMNFTLSNAVGVTISDGEAVGTITNTDPFPKAWIARLARTMAEQHIDAITLRLEASRERNAVIGIDGSSFDYYDTGNTVIGVLGPAADGYHSHTLSTDGYGYFGHTVNSGDDDDLPELRVLSVQDALENSSFALTGEQDATGASFAVWGRAANNVFDGKEGGLTLDGKVTTGFVGFDYGSDNWLAGLAVSKTSAKGNYSGRSVGETDSADKPTSGTIEAKLTSVTAYGATQMSDKTEIWGAFGSGQGSLTLKPSGAKAEKTDLDWSMAAGGARSTLYETRNGSGELALITDAMWSSAKSDKKATLAAAKAYITRVRVGLESSWHSQTGTGGVISPTLEFGLRHDGGDAENGLGVELGGSIKWNEPSTGFSLDLSSRALISHENDNFEERGYSAGIVFDPDPTSDRGLSLTIRHDVGAESTGGLEALFSNDPLSDDAEESSNNEQSWTLDAGYGVPALGGTFTGVPNAGIRLYEDARDVHIGWKLKPAGANPYDFSLGLEATRRESDDTEPEHGIQFDISTRW